MLCIKVTKIVMYELTNSQVSLRCCVATFRKNYFESVIYLLSA